MLEAGIEKMGLQKVKHSTPSLNPRDEVEGGQGRVVELDSKRS